MEVHAAVAFTPGKPLDVTTVTLVGPRALPLGDINKAFDLMHAGESIRSVVAY